MQFEIEVENIRCNGCANTISKKLLAIAGVQSVAVKIEAQTVVIEADDESIQQAAINTLSSLGYPLKGSVEGLEAIKDKAKSVVSCAIGKVS